MLKKFLLTILLLPAMAFSQVYVLEVQGTIDMGLAHFFKRVIPEINAEAADAIILDIDTFGGRVDAATEMRNALLQSDVTTIAFINTKAISAGALISLACDTIIMHSGATMGATTVVDVQSNKAGEKAQSYMREEMAATAEANHRNPDIAMAMVDESLDIDTLVSGTGDTLFIDDIKGAVAGKLVTLRTSTALKYGMADYEMDTMDEVFEHYGFSPEDRHSVAPTWSEGIVRFLTDPIVSSLLMTIGFLGIIFELQSPGWGIPGSVGLLALALFFSTSIIADLASMTDLLILLLGLALLGIEAFVIPGFGVMGILGIIVLVFGLFSLLIPEMPTQADINRALVGLTISLAGGIAALVILIRGMSHSKIWQKISLSTSEVQHEGYSSSLGLEELIGQQGVALTKLRPAGTADFEGRRVDVVTLGDYINQGESIEVLRVDGNRIIVRKSTQ